MLRRLVAVALVGHLAAFALPALIAGAQTSGEGTVIAQRGVAGGALSGLTLLALGVLGAAPGLARPWLMRRTAGVELRALVLLCGALGALGAAGLASRLAGSLALPGSIAPAAVAIAGALAAGICLLRSPRAYADLRR